MRKSIASSGFAFKKLISEFPRVGVALAAALSCAHVSAQSPQQATAADSHAPGRILVMARAGLPDSALAKILTEQGGGLARAAGKSGLRIVDLPRGLERRMVDLLKQHPQIEFAELDQRVALHASNDPFLGSQWHLSKIGAVPAWNDSTGSGIKIAILDTGVDAAHPDLAERMLPGYNFYDNNTDTSDVQGHGTAVAGSAAATLNNGTGVASVAGQARIIPIRVSQPDGYAYFSTIASALTWAADQGARVANISYGVSGSAAVQSSANYMKSKGGLVVVSAGNNGVEEGTAANSAMITVSATDSSDRRTSWSSFGNFVDIAAPGAGIYTTNRGGSYGSWNGTSFSSPVTAGVVALMMSANPALSSAQVQTLLFNTATDLGTAGFDKEYGWGRVDANAAVQAALASVSTVDTQAPSVAIGNPLASSTVSGLVAVDVSAVDNVGVVRVDLFANGSRVASDSSAPFAFSWDSKQASNGNAELKAVAVDAAGNSGTSAGVWVNVSNASTTPADTTPPVVAISNPGNGSTVSGMVRVTVNASDNSGSAGISNQLYVGTRLVASGAGSSLGYEWNVRPLKRGSYTLKAVSKDAAGNTSSVTVTVTR